MPRSKSSLLARLAFKPTGWRAFVARSLVLLGLVGALSTSLAINARARGLPVQEGILNFGKVSEHVYRGAQPDSDGIKHLQKLGVKLIVNLRMPPDGWKEEETEAVASGMV